MRQEMNKKSRAYKDDEDTPSASVGPSSRYGEDGSRRRKMAAYVFQQSRKNGTRQLREDGLNALWRF